MIVRGIYHAHSTFSNDGHFALADLVAEVQRRGYQFIIMTEHAEDLTPERYRAFHAACKKLSTEEFVCVSGLEVPYEGKVHVGCFPGAPTYDQVPLYRDGIVYMRAHGALAIYHHPTKQEYFMDERFRTVLDGVEVWNSRYEGWVAPSMRTYRFGRRFFKNAHHLCGLDIHHKGQFKGPHLSLNVTTLTEEAIVEAIKNRQYTLRGAMFTYQGSAVHGIRLVWYGLVRSLYACGKFLRDTLRTR